MSEDRSLDEFVAPDDGTVEEADTPAGDDLDTTPADGVTTAVGEGAVPATTTSAWSDDGGICERCGDTVTRLWGDDGMLVCPECKVW